MINVHALASGAIQQVNADTPVVWLRSTGSYTTDAAGHRAPVMASQTVDANVQGLSASDLQHAEGLNIQGVLRSVHLYGNVQGVVRADQQGGDILQFPAEPGGAARNWRVIQVMETWPTWCRVLVHLQNP
ncbi:MAG: hypothetical protein FWF20_12270 [Betaproteobacteria bacterium]|nr:hypothetical protein [Betaproteobacteria bacterium]